MIQNDIDATKKEATKQMEQNENLEQFKQRLNEDSLHLNKQCNQFIFVFNCRQFFLQLKTFSMIFE